MVSELLKKRLYDSIGKQVKIFLLNGFGYDGKITNIDEIYIEIIKNRDRNYKLIKLIDINDCEIIE